MFMICRPVASGGLGGPPVFGETVNPILTMGQIMPTTVIQAPRIFRPCDGSDMYAWIN